MSTLLMAGVLAAYAGCMTLAVRRRFERQLPLAAGLILLILYGFALADQLRMGAYAVLALALAAGIGMCILLIRGRRQQVWKWLFTPGLAGFLLVILWLLLGFRGHLFTQWDDFSHWGLAVKNMALFEKLPTLAPKTQMAYASYPPAATLFSWLWSFLSGAFNEGDAQRALNLLTLCFLLPLMCRTGWKRPVSALCTLLLLFLLPLVFETEANVYRKLQVDALLGCMILYALSTWFMHPNDWHTLAAVGCALFWLPLVKESGLLHGGLVLLIIGADALCNASRSQKKKMLLLLGLILTLLVGWGSWEIHLRLTQTGETWNYAAYSMADVLAVFSGRGTELQNDTLKRFFAALCSAERGIPGHLFRLSHAACAALFVLGGWLVSRRMPQGIQRRRWRGAFGMMLICALFYTVTVLLLMEFMFSAWEMRALNSLERYIGTWLLPMLGMGIAGLFQISGERRSGWRGKISLPLVALLALLMIVDPRLLVDETLRAEDQNRKAAAIRNACSISESVYELNPDTDRVFLIAPGTTGVHYVRIAYQVAPLHLQEDMHSAWLRTSIEADDIVAGTPLSAQEWAQLLRKQFTHVYVYETDQRFLTDYQELFADPDAIANDRLYRVEPQEDGVLLYAVN